MPPKSPRSWRKTVVLTRLSRGVPASSRIARRLAKICSVCSSIGPSARCVSPGRNASWPDTNTNPFALIACEYGAPWNGPGAASVRTTSFMLLPPASCSSLRRAASLREGAAERLEDRHQHVLRVPPFEHAHVDGQARPRGELVQEARDDVAREPADSVVREVDVRDDDRAVAQLERRRGECFVRGQERPPRPGGAAAKRLRQRVSERASGGGDLLVRAP